MATMTYEVGVEALAALQLLVDEEYASRTAGRPKDDKTPLPTKETPVQYLARVLDTQIAHVVNNTRDRLAKARAAELSVDLGALTVADIEAIRSARTKVEEIVK